MKKLIGIALVIGLFIFGSTTGLVVINNNGNKSKMTKENKIVIDFLYLDLSACERCQATDKVLDEALDELREELKDVEELTVNKIKILSDKQAKKYDFVRSPTIRINGIDIGEILTGKLEIKDNYCESCACVGVCSESCSEVTGGGTRCRIFEYNGKTYEAVPKEMIKDAIMEVLGINVTEASKDRKEDKTENSCCAQSSQTSSCCG